MGASTATFAYRTDWFKEVGAAKFPETLDEFRKVGSGAEEEEPPFGQTLGHTFGDPNAGPIR